VELLIAYSNFLPEVEQPLEALSRLHERPDSGVNLTLVSPPRKLRKRPPKSVIAEMISDYLAGMSTRQLAKEYDIPKTSVLSILHSEGVVRAHHRISEQQIQRATYLIANGKSVTVTAQELGVVSRTLYSKLKQRGLPTRAS
jgi:transposase-like protein